MSSFTEDTFLSAEELVEAAEITEAANDMGVKIVILPGYPYVGALEESTGQLLKDESGSLPIFS